MAVNVGRISLSSSSVRMVRLRLLKVVRLEHDLVRSPANPRSASPRTHQIINEEAASRSCCSPASFF